MPTHTTPISQKFAELRPGQQRAFIPFITAGDPDLATTPRLIRLLAEAGADLIEIGFPYSDPIADGPVIQESYTRALQQKLTVNQIFDMVGSLRDEGLPPLVAMVSYAIIFRHGVDQFIKQARQAGFAGFIVPDLPTDEASELAPQMQAAGLDLIQLIAPTTTRERAENIMAHSSGFIYCIAVAGITGARENLSAGLFDQLKWLKSRTEIPLAVGFGISRPEHVPPLREVADGVIVGSAIVRYLQAVAEGEQTLEQALPALQEFASQMSQAAHTTNP